MIGAVHQKMHRKQSLESRKNNASKETKGKKRWSNFSNLPSNNQLNHLSESQVAKRWIKNSIFLYANGISLNSYNVADLFNFARIIQENIRFAKQNPFQSCKASSRKRLSESSLTKHKSQLSNE